MDAVWILWDTVGRFFLGRTTKFQDLCHGRWKLRRLLAELRLLIVRERHIVRVVVAFRISCYRRLRIAACDLIFGGFRAARETSNDHERKAPYQDAGKTYEHEKCS